VREDCGIPPLQLVQCAQSPATPLQPAAAAALVDAVASEVDEPLQAAIMSACERVRHAVLSNKGREDASAVWSCVVEMRARVAEIGRSRVREAAEQVLALWVGKGPDSDAAPCLLRRLLRLM